MPFKVKSKVDLNDAKVGDVFEESDFATILDDGKFIQMEFFEEEEKHVIQEIKVRPGTWRIQSTSMGGAFLEEAQLLDEKVLDEFINTKEVVDRIDCFFKNIKVYKKYEIFPKRGILLYGDPGVGKSTAIKEICKKYTSDKETAVVIWDTIKFKPSFVKDVISSFKYIKVKKLILIVEDIGGIEVDRMDQRYADSSLLKLLDNTEKTFSIPTLILATTNFPQNLLGSLANRPQRFDDKIKVDPPDPQGRVALFEFFLDRKLKKRGDESKFSKEISQETSNKLTPAHIRDIIIRSELYSMSFSESLASILKDVEDYDNNFREKRQGRVGFNS